MTRALRAFLGALGGAVIALYLHPLSRPWLNYGFRGFGPSPTVSSSPHLARTLRKVPPPDTDDRLSLFVQAAFERMASGQKLDDNNALLLAELCRSAAVQDPQNAFWRQSEAVFQDVLGNAEAADTAWQRAANRNQWNDFQSSQVERFLLDLQSESGAPMSWHSAVASDLRCVAADRAITSFGLAKLSSDPSLKCRYQTLSNAALLRDNARSRIGSWFGYRLGETAATGPFTSAGSQKAKTFRREEFPTELIRAGMGQEGDSASKILKENEAYRALVFTSQAEKDSSRRRGQSVLLSTAPGSLLLASATCAALLLAVFAAPVHRLGEPLHPIIPAGSALAIAISTYLATQNVLVSLWVLVTVALFAIHPPVCLTSPTLKIPRAALAAGTTCAVLFAGLVACFGIVHSTPFVSLAQYLPTGWWSEGDWPIIGSGLLVVGMFLILCQATSYRLKRPAGRFCLLVARHGLAQSALASLFGAVLLTPICIYLDDRLNQDLKKVALNETAYYINR